ncbi:hypothetical protein [Hoylesella saccharolytica]|uniref:hypothetical protein n=1 Tax=Hoylesella saccharolytica TaxID=633701 RepID=UPI000470E2FE|nr:hypothetical protein [Hoylesella saccharolytica]
MKYNTGKGCLTLVSQDIDDPSKTYSKIWFGAADMKQGKVTFEDGAGFDITWDKATNKALFTDNGKGGTISINSFVLIGKDAKGELARDSDGYLATVAILRYLSSMKK